MKPLTSMEKQRHEWETHEGCRPPVRNSISDCRKNVPNSSMMKKKEKKKKTEDIKQMSEEDTNATVHFYKTSGKYSERQLLQRRSY